MFSFVGVMEIQHCDVSIYDVGLWIACDGGNNKLWRILETNSGGQCILFCFPSGERCLRLKWKFGILPTASISTGISHLLQNIDI